MNNAIVEYFEALERLKVGKPNRVPKNTRITNDSVSLEAGRGKGSIKKSRPAFAALIEAIDAAATIQAQLEPDGDDRVEKLRTSALRYREELESALAREVSLLLEVYNLKKELAALTGGNVLPLRPKPDASTS